MTRFLFFPSF